MSDPERLTACACCSGIQGVVPVQVTNRPGLAAISFRIGTHAAFRETMLAAISSTQHLRDLGRRSNEDFTIALMDAWAVALDVLTFYQERMMNEAFLRTATERRSLLELGRLIGYELRPGVAAAALLAFILDSTPGSPSQVLIAAGTAAQSIPTKEEVPQTFETSADLLSLPRWNALTPRTSFHQTFDETTRSFYVQGTSANLRPVDPMLLVTGATGDVQTFLRVQTAKAEPENTRTLVTLAAAPPAFSGYLAPGKQLVNVVDGSFGSLNASAKSGVLNATKIGSALSISGQSMSDWIRVVAANRAQTPPLPTPGSPGLYALRASASVFGHNAPALKLKEDGTTWEEQDLSTTAIDYDGAGIIFLDQEVKGVLDNDWVVLVSRNQGPSVYQVSSSSPESIAKFGLSGKSTRIVLKPGPGGPQLSSVSNYLLRETSVYLTSELLILAELPIETVDTGTDTLEVVDVVPDLPPHRTVILTGERMGDFAGVIGSEPLEVAAVGQGLFTTLYFTKPVKFSYKRKTVTINANVVTATNGETHSEVLGSGDGSQAFQSFAPKFNPLTYVSSADSPTGGVSTLAVHVNGVLWKGSPGFFQLEANDRAYVVRLDDSGKTLVMFGDGIHGARLPSGSGNVTAVYRSGIGTPGLVGANRIQLLPRKPLGVKSVNNPIASSGAQDAETRDQARINAPLTVRTLDRIVSLTDFEDFARSFSGIGKSRADWIWAGNRRVIHVTVAAPAGGELSDTVLTNLIGAMDKARVLFQPVKVSPFEKLLFNVSAKLKIDPDYVPKTVLAAADAAMRAAFSFDARGFAQRVATSEIEATLQGIPGVIFVDLDSLTYEISSGGNTADEFGLPALSARYDQATNSILAAQLLMISPAPLDLREIL
jgi:predicted phage baseplate assembly protein